jgi:predicted RNA-binding protein YlqC (UPF0109 family)
MSDIDQQFIEYVVKSLVGKPEAVHIDRRIDEKGVLLELTVDPDDLGRVIGKRGATAQSLRTLLRALGTKNDARYNLKIIDNGVGAQSADDVPANDTKVSDSDNDDARPAPTPQQKASSDEPADTVIDESAGAKDDDTDTTSPAEQNQTSDRVRQARAELADLDDLDV